MEIYTYLLYSGGIMALMSLFYWLILRKETFFQANRWVLMGNILLALLIPLIPTPSSIQQLKKDLIVSFTAEPADIKPSSELILTAPNITYDELDIPVEETEALHVKEKPISFSTTLKWIYLIGVLIMLFRFIIQVFSVFQQIKHSEITKGAGYYLATNNKDISPFSFWKYIVVNPNKYSESSFLHILEHERIHVLQRHTIDLVLSELFLVIQWCNPLAWWNRHLVDQNLEFLVDQTLLENGENKQTYQYHLVQVAVPNSPLSISSNYNSSQLKKRIKMMNLQRSSLAASWKYALLLPIAFLLLVGFTDTQNENELPIASNETTFKKAPESSYVIITEDASEADLKELQDKLYEFGFVLSFDKLTIEDNKIIELEALLDYNDNRNTKIPASWDEDSPSPRVALFTNEANSRFGNFHLNEIMVKDLADRIPKEEIFIAGNFSLSNTLNKIRSQIKAHQEKQEVQFQKNIKDENWEGELTKMGSVYGPDISNKNIIHIKDLIEKKGYPTTYYLDGIKNNESVLDIPVTDIEKIEFNELRYRKFNKAGKFIGANPWNYEVKVKRKGKQKSAPKELNINELEEVYIILTEEASKEDIEKIQSELLKHELELVVKNLVYNDAQKIENIEVELKVKGASKATHSWTKSREGYKFMVLFRDWKNDETGAGYETELLIKARKVNQNGKLYIIGNRDSEELNQFLMGQMKKAKKIRIEKENIVINKSEENLQKNSQQKPLKRGFHYFEACGCYIPKMFSPSTEGAVFIIEGNDPSKKSSFNLYNKWGTEIFKASPYQNDWKGFTIFGEKIKLGTYYFTFQAEEGLEVVNGFLKIVDEALEEKLKNDTGFIHNPHDFHYIVTLTTPEDFEDTKDFIKPSLFMTGNTSKRYSSIYLGENKTLPLFIIRKFDSYAAAKDLAQSFNKFSDKPKSVHFIAIGKDNYQIVIRQKSLVKYLEFYKNL